MFSAKNRRAENPHSFSTKCTRPSGHTKEKEGLGLPQLSSQSKKGGPASGHRGPRVSLHLSEGDSLVCRIVSVLVLGLHSNNSVLLYEKPLQSVFKYTLLFFPIPP